jgi:acyl transferase domain-containing protein/NAD(P)H-dependent flavin oxidoreductase YrpB (nitropropane dioxygenase family)/NADP-dependent 3-hydroxy acid dehydrogenase YdfG
MSAPGRDLIWVQTPFEEPAPRIVIGAARAGALGLLDLGSNADRARSALDVVGRRTAAPFGIRVSSHCRLDLADLPEAVQTIVVADPALVGRWRDGFYGRRVVAEVRSTDEARAALEADADGLVAKGAESAGRVGTTGAYVLSQQLQALTDLPVWVHGGIGRHTAAAAIIGGAAGVVIDAQVALLKEAALPTPVRTALAAMDGSETRVVDGRRVYDRPLAGPGLNGQGLPVGQDAAFASRFADRYGTVGRMVTALRREIVEHVDAAVEIQPLAPGHGVATVLGTRYPVVQGPMTRVSDRPAFAAAVAEAGGLPFLALALLRAGEVRPLLEDTAALVGDQPWGVGVLGFVPKDLRDEQLEVIRDVRPPLALIAGGRPSQAAALEEVGIRTFLHVPAPGLLERFLKDGARRFVFEGFECGGHVGPRSSFALWETQIEVLLDWGAASGELDELDVLFAGGIHDERSAAMVAALSAPLAAAGARVGVLMGTAYLFTEEAVAAGAVGDEFQAQALACERTALLESGPGHATRCAETPFVELFEQTRRDLAANGADAQLQWAELESLNLGRLRVASKGLRREGDDLVTVDRDEQRRDGMFMIGDVATLHDRRTTMAELHQSVTAGATAYLAAEAEVFGAELTAERPRPWQPEPVDVAIVGMACVMPGARDLDGYWKNILEGVNAITEVPPERWDVDKYFDPDWDHATAQKTKDVRSASKWGGFVPDIGFDALAYGIPPASLAAIEPTQLLALKVAADALADAGYAAHDSFDRARTSVIFGAEAGSDQLAAHCFRALFPAYAGELPGELDDWLPEMTEDTFPGLLTNVISGRIANRLDLGGKNLTVDAACASSLAALDAGCMELATGGSNLVLCGGADVHNGVHDYLLFTSVHALSTIGQCRTFDAEADGIALGEGVACVVLKRLADAERDGDRVYAVIRSVAGSSDGRSLGLTAPRREGQELSLRRAYAQAGIEVRDVGLIEAHGTGTVVGDRTELSTLTEVFDQAGADQASCVVGSVKSNIGHTKCAAGLAGLIKAAKAVYHGVLPPTLNVDQPNPAWNPDTSPFVFLDATRPWLDRRRVAGVSAFGFGGTNFHAVLESHDDEMPEAVASSAWPAELLVFRGELPAVDRALADLAERLDGPDAAAVERNHRLRDVAASCASAERGPVRVAIVADDFADLRAKLDHALQRRPAPGVYLADATDVTDAAGQPPPVAFLFPGQGSQRPGMASDLFVAFPETRELLRLGQRWVPTMLPAQPFGDAEREAQRQALTDTRVAQPALGLADLACAKVLWRFGVQPDMVAGHSYGELVALCVAGALDERSLLRLSAARGEAIVSAIRDDPGGMVAVSAPRERLEPVLDGVDVVVANDNHPEQLVVAGRTPAIEEVLGRLKDAGITARRLPVACAFHSPVVAGASDTLDSHLAEVEVAAPGIPVFSNRTAETYPADPAKIRDLVAAQVANPVRFTEQVQAMYQAGARVFVEVGPGRTLTGCVERILDGQPHVAVATDRAGDHGVRSMLHALAQLAVAGVAVDVAPLFEGRAVDPTRWTRSAASPGWLVNGHLVRTAKGDVVPGGLRPVTSVPRIAPVGPAGSVGSIAPSVPAVAFPGNGTNSTNGTNGVAGAGGTRAPDEVLVEYFRAANQIIGAGHQLVLNYLGIAPNGNGGAALPSLAPVPASVAPTAAAVAPSVGTAPLVEEVAAEASAPASAALPTPEELLAKLVAIVSVRTGYPEDMLDPDLDVEADLSIDSIKRLEILAALADEVELADGSLVDMEDLIEELAARKTLRGIVDFLFEHAPGLSQAPAGEHDEPVVPPPFRSPVPPVANCFTMSLVEAPLSPPGDTSGLTVEVTGTGPLVSALVHELGARGIPASTVRDAVSAGAARLIVLTDLLDASDASLGGREPIDIPQLYGRLRPLLLDTTCDVVVVSPLGGGIGLDPPPPRPPGPTGRTDDPGADLVPVGAGARGVVKTAALEFPGRRVRLVDVDPAVPVDQLARTLGAEVTQTDAPVEVGWRDGRRTTPQVSMRPRPVLTPDAPLPLTPDSVVLVTGGARGITARAAVALAQRSRCHVELVGRSALPQGEEDPAFATCQDRVALRSALVAAGWREPRTIEKEVDRILVEREIRATLADLAQVPESSAAYHQVDVRDADALTALVDAIYERRGRLDGIVHGAGVVDDHFIADKSPAEFQKVFSTKVDAARTLLAAVSRATGDGRHARPSFVAFFGSIAGVCGNRGQADYAAANDALDAIAAANADVATRVFAIDWGPWSPETGMVSESLVPLYQDSGMGLIQVEDGTAVLLDEIAAGVDGAAQVMVVRCAPELLP